MLKEINRSEKILMDPFNFGFVEEEIAVYQHGKTTIYDTDFNKKFEVPVFSNGFKNFITKLPNGDYGIFNRIYDGQGIMTDKKYKVSKKSVQKYAPKRFIDKENKYLIGGFVKGGIIVIYDHDLRPVNEIQLGKFETLVHYNPNKNIAFTFDKKSGIVGVYSYPHFEKRKEFKVNKLNDRFEFSSDGRFIFNYGYKPDNRLINIETDEMKKVMFHPTTKSGYKEQYKTAHNFGTYSVKSNEKFTYLAATTHQNRAVIYNVILGELLDLKLHEHYHYDKFNYPSGKYPFGNVTFEEERFIANVGRDLTIWNYAGELIDKKENITPIRKHPNGKYYALIEECLAEIEIL